MILQELGDNLLLARRDPEPCVGATARYFNEVGEVPRTLYVARVVPAEMSAVSALNHPYDRIHPLWVLQRSHPFFLGVDHVLEDVATFECIAAGTDRSLDLHQC